MIAPMHYKRVISFLLAVCVAAVSLPGGIAAPIAYAAQTGSAAPAHCHAAGAAHDSGTHRHAVPEKHDCQRTRLSHDCCVPCVAIAPPARIMSLADEHDTLIARMPACLRPTERAADIYRPPWRHA
ncbi:MAG: hypothetical protein LBI92_00090 [Azoarcus sp.]|jgi:hypothetical protein|nr:hypothetical protein [Azoarcus sp.]